MQETREPKEPEEAYCVVSGGVPMTNAEFAKKMLAISDEILRRTKREFNNGFFYVNAELDPVVEIRTYEQDESC